MKLNKTIDNYSWIKTSLFSDSKHDGIKIWNAKKTLGCNIKVLFY